MHDRIMRGAFVALAFVACQTAPNVAPDASPSSAPLVHLFEDGVLYAQSLDGHVFSGEHLDHHEPILDRARSISGAGGPLDLFPPPTGSECAALSTGEVVCTGSNVDGNLGSIATDVCGDEGCTSSMLDAATNCAGLLSYCCYPCVTAWTVLPDAVNLLQVHRNCGIDYAGNVVCWGRSNPTFPLPVRKLAGDFAILANGDLVRIATKHLVLTNVRDASTDALTRSSCAVTTDTSLYCWGENLFGEVGDGTTTPRTDPVLVGTGYRVVRVFFGLACAIRTDDTVACWGGVNLDSDAPPTLTPTSVAGLVQVREVALIDTRFDALLRDGSVVQVAPPFDAPRIETIHPR